MTSPDAPRPRRCFVLTGERAATRAGAARLLSELPTEQALYLGPAELAGASGSARDAKRYLGQSFAAVVLDLHEGLDADLLGQVHGLIRGGGVLVLLTPPAGRAPLDPEGRLAVHPFGPTDVGQRLWGRLQRALRAKAGGPVRFLRPEEAKGQPPLHADDRPLTGTVEQAAVVSQLLDFVVEPGPSAGAAVLTADRGRGKSSALGLLLAALDDSAAGLRIALTGPHRAAVHEVERFAEAAPAFWDPGELGQPGAEPYDLILVDEAAQLSVPLLQRLVQAHPRARWIFATTVHGYEGTGRGFALRFVEWLRALEEERGRSVVELTLREPIRWAPGDPLEALVFDALALDAEPASFEEAPASGLPGDEAAVEVRELDREELAHDD